MSGKVLGWLVVIPVILLGLCLLAAGLAGIAAIVYIFGQAALAVF